MRRSLSDNELEKLAQDLVGLSQLPEAEGDHLASRLEIQLLETA